MKHYFECRCSLDAHRVVLNLDNDDADEQPILGLGFHLNVWKPWYLRVWDVIMYILGRTEHIGDFDDWLLSENDALRLRDAVDEYIESHNTWVRGLGAKGIVHELQRVEATGGQAAE